MKSKQTNNLFLISLFILSVVFFNSSHCCTCRRMSIEDHLNHSDYSCTFKILDKNEKEEFHAIYFKGKAI